MAVKSSSKQKLLSLIDVFEKLTDENNVISTNEIVEELAKRGITAERKSIYADIALLVENGYDIIKVKTPKSGYFLASRNFQLPEIRLIIDAVQSADFITPKKTEELISKIGTLVSEDQFEMLKSQLSISNRVKTLNEEIFYTIDVLNRAIEEKKQVSFSYIRHKIEAGKKIVMASRDFIVNPYALVWSNDHYYLICNNPKYDNLMHTRLDRMRKVKIVDIPARSFEEVSEYKGEFDVADYSNKMFNMFSGKICEIEIVCKNEMLEDIVDRFGENATIRNEDSNRFYLRAEVALSDGLVSWLMQYRNSVYVRKPEELREHLKEKAQEIIDLYN
ncbi:MAG: WYL domain-containing protein [Clostridia bacterium]|nr:WYL domain-containing protein [Clostridia bacterium]